MILFILNRSTWLTLVYTAVLLVRNPVKCICTSYVCVDRVDGAEVSADAIMLPLFPTHRDGQLVFLTEEERASLAQVNPGSSEPSDSGLLERLFSSDISSVYRLGKK